MKLHELKPRDRGRVQAIREADGDMAVKLREFGFSEGDEIEMMGSGPFGGRTLAVRLNRTLIALRMSEADLIEVEPA
jgi:Fe2+ transport system protein FeoA